MLGAPFCITILVTKYERLCFQTFAEQSPYVFEPTDLYNIKYDNGDSTIQTSRRGDILKFWLMWKIKVNS